MPIGRTSLLVSAFRSRSGGRTAFLRIALASVIACALATVLLAQGTQAPRTNPQPQSQPLRQMTSGRLIIPITGALETPTDPTIPAEPPPISMEPPTAPLAPPTTPAEPPTTPAEPPTTTMGRLTALTPTTPGGDAALARQVTGSFSIQRFAQTTDGAVAAVGTLTVSFADPASGMARTIVTQVAMPVARSSDVPTSSAAGIEPKPISATTQTSLSASASTQPCETLSLLLGPLALDLLGVAVQLDQVNVDFTVVPGTNGQRLGVLLCRVTDVMDSGVGPAERVSMLNALLNTVG